MTMRKLTILIAATLASTLPAVAAPIALSSVSIHGEKQLNGPFTHVFSPFQLSHTSRLGFSLTAFTESGEASDLVINGIELSQGQQRFTFRGDTLRHLGDRCLNLDGADCLPDDLMFWYRDYQLADVELGAGAWTLTVHGNDRDNKLWSEYSLQAQVQRVPEPWTLALALAALAPALGLRRRQGR